MKKNDPLEMEEYAVWMNRMYQEWPLRGTTTRSGREKKKNAGEISLTILAEVFHGIIQTANQLRFIPKIEIPTTIKRAHGRG